MKFFTKDADMVVEQNKGSFSELTAEQLLDVIGGDVRRGSLDFRKLLRRP